MRVLSPSRPCQALLIFTKLHIHNLHHIPWPNLNANYSKVALTKLGRRAEQWNHSTNLFTQKAKVTFQFYLRTHIALTFNWNSCSGKRKKVRACNCPFPSAHVAISPLFVFQILQIQVSSHFQLLIFHHTSYNREILPILRSNQLDGKTLCGHTWSSNLMECVLFVS